MASPAQIAANQLNNRKSTGPRTPEGRAKMSAAGEIDENAPSEANFDETMSIVEAPESIQVTPNSGALSGLDNGLVRLRAPGGNCVARGERNATIGGRDDDRDDDHSERAHVSRCLLRA